MKGFLFFIWLTFTIVLVSVAFDMLNASNTIENFLGLAVLAFSVFTAKVSVKLVNKVSNILNSKDNGRKN
jgi:succinate-acetate transporter protein